MHDKNYEFKEENLESVYENKCGEINFRKKQRITKIIGKYLIFIIIAMISGIISSNYIIDKKYGQLLKENEKIYLMQGDKSLRLNENHVVQIAENVGPTIVGITNSLVNGKNILGSGIIFNSDGYILTTYDIVNGFKDIKVKLASGKGDIKGKFIGFDKELNLAVIKIDVKNLPIAKFGDSSKVRIGDRAIAIGNTFENEFPGMVTTGNISSSNSKIKNSDYNYRIFKTDALINELNNGGALCNEEGEVIGINNFKLKKECVKQTYEIGCAISINEIKKSLGNIMKKIEKIKPQIGIIGRKAIIEDDGIEGVYVSDVKKESGAEKASIKPKDIIIEINNININECKDIFNIIEKYKVGDTIECKIWRSGKTIIKNVIL